MQSKKLLEMVDNRIPGLPVILAALTIIELSIFILCLVYSGENDLVKIYNPKNELIFEDTYNYSDISQFKGIIGIRSFKNEGYTVKRIGGKTPFPIRAWIALSVILPLILIFFVIFTIKAFDDIFHSKTKTQRQEKKSSPDTTFEETRFEKLFSTLGRLNIYSLGGAVIFTVFLYWMIPDLIIHLSRISYQTIVELKWVILGIVLFGGVFLLVRVFLTFATRREIIRQQADIQKHRDQLTIESKLEQKLLESEIEKNTNFKKGSEQDELTEDSSQS
jgi:hypothetical protein